MSDPLRAFIPAWLDDAGLGNSEFRLICHLIRRADNVTGIAWPSYESMMEVCGMSRATVARTLDALVSKKLIEKLGKNFGGSTRYRISGATVSPEEPLASNSLTGDTIESSPIVPQMRLNRSPNESSIVSPEEREGYPKKVIQRRVSNSLSDSLAEEIWKLAPSKGKERSSKSQLTKALRKIPAADLPDITTIGNALAAWKLSETWTKDGGQYVKGIHRWVEARQWGEIPESGASPNNVNLGRRQSSFAGIIENIDIP